MTAVTLLATGRAIGDEEPAADQRVTARDAKMDEYLQRLVEGPDDFALIDCVCGRIPETDDPASLPLEQRTVHEIWGAGGLIGNGGMGYLFDSIVRDLSATAAAFDRIGASSAAEALRAGFTVFPNASPPLDPDERIRLMEQMDAQTHDFLDHECSDRFYRADHEVQRKLALYIRQHIAAFAQLPPSEWDGEKLEELKQKKTVAVPSQDASSEDVIDWIESIGGHASRWSGRNTDREGLGAPPEDDPIAMVSLPRIRNCTDSDIEQLSRMQALAHLRQLSLSDTCVTERGTQHLFRFPELRSLDLSETDASDDSLAVVVKLVHLRHLDLSRTRVTDKGMGHLSTLASLDNLDVSRTDVGDVGIESLTACSGLSELRLVNSEATIHAFESIAKMPSLRVLTIGGRRMTAGPGLSAIARLNSLEFFQFSADKPRQQSTP